MLTSQHTSVNCLKKKAECGKKRRKAEHENLDLLGLGCPWCQDSRGELSRVKPVSSECPASDDSSRVAKQSSDNSRRNIPRYRTNILLRCIKYQVWNSITRDVNKIKKD